MILALAPLWKLTPPMPDNILHHPAFESFLAYCRETFPPVDKGIGVPFAFLNALRSLGLPCAQNARGIELPARPLEDVVDDLIIAIEATSTTRHYLCPLDMADTLPEMRFGGAHIAKFDAQALRKLFGDCRLARLNDGHCLDVGRLAQFHWLVVAEETSIPSRIGERALPFLYKNLGSDLGAIDPHLGSHAPVVTQALFAILLAPWEEWHSYVEMDWRGFQIPWVYLENGDIFRNPMPVPSADLLTWEPAGYEDEYGEQIEYERPIVVHLDEEAKATLSAIDHCCGNRLEIARLSPLFETPIEHFMVRAYFARGMDEIMAHMTAIEAGLGLRSDFRRAGGAQPKVNMTATERMIRRVSVLLHDQQAGQDYKKLFDLRSAFVHGRAIEGAIPSADRNLARTLARRITVALIDVANSDIAPASREDFLAHLI